MRNPTPLKGHRMIRGATAWRRRVLFLSCHLPFPPISGGRRRELELITRLARQFDIHLVVVSKTPEQDLAGAEFMAAMCHAVDVFAAEPPTSPSADDWPIQLRRHRSSAAAARVAEVLDDGDIDLVHVEGFYLVQHVPSSTEVPVLLVEQNIEFALAHQRAIVERDPDRRLELFSDCMRTRAAEVQAWRDVAALATVTAEDRDVIKAELANADVSVVSNGADHLPPLQGRQAHMDRPAAPLVVLLANFAYAPNADAAHHLCRDILPALRAKVPDVQTWLVGNAPPREVQALADHAVEITGGVADVLPYLDTADVMVCPLRIGGGIKVKMIEALRRGKAIVSTPVGAQGLHAPARNALVIEEDPHAFADAVASLLTDRARRLQLERRARRAAGQLPTWDDAANRLADIYHQLLARSQPIDPEPVRTVAARSL